MVAALPTAPISRETVGTMPVRTSPHSHAGFFEIHRAGPPRNHDPSDTMSNATHQSRKTGEGRRRRSRGGRNRNDNKQHDGRRRGEQGSRQGRSEEFRPQGARQQRGAKPPVKLSWWQKLLKAIGLYKEPARPERQWTRAETKSPPKSNVRNARSGDGEAMPAVEPAKRARRGGDPSSVESARLYVGNLSYDVTEQDLQELLKGVGGVRNVEIVYNRSTHRSKGYGFVEMLHKDEAMRAVEVLHDQPFMGRKLIVSGAKSKGQDEREDRDEADSRERIISLAPLPEESPEPTPDESLEPIPELPEPAAMEQSPPAESAADEPERRSEVA